MAQQLTERQKKHLRGLAHAREPIVNIGNGGLSPGVEREFELALLAHELLKVRARVGDREQRDLIMAELARRSGATLVQQIGNVGVFYRRNQDKPRLTLPAD